MRRSLMLTVAAVTVMVLLAMLVPMAVLVRNYAVEDRLARAALELQATETVVSAAGQDKGTVSVYLDRANRGGSTRTTVLYPDGTAIGPNPGEDDRVREARRTGQARVDDTDDGPQILVPVALGGSTALPRDTPVVRVDVPTRGVSRDVALAWGVLALLGLALLAASLVMADRLGRRFVGPIRSLARTAADLGDSDLDTRVVPDGPPEVQEVGAALNRLVERVGELIERERENVADLSHRLRTPVTVLRLGVEQLPPGEDRQRISEGVDDLERMVDHVVREARRSEREGLSPSADAAEVVAAQARFWSALAEDQGRGFEVDLADGPLPVHAAGTDLASAVEVLLDNVFTHTPEGVPVRVALARREGGGALLVVEDGGPGVPEHLDVVRRGASGAGSTGLGLSIARRTAESSGGSLEVGRSDLGGARVALVLGAPH